MDVSSFFSRLVQPAKSQGVLRQPDDLDDIDIAWQAVKVSFLTPQIPSGITEISQETLEHPDERQIVRYASLGLYYERILSDILREDLV